MRSLHKITKLGTSYFLLCDKCYYSNQIKDNEMGKENRRFWTGVYKGCEIKPLKEECPQIP
jgi:hypothetical protein